MRIYILSILLLLANLAQAQINKAIQTLTQDNDMKYASWSICVLDVNNGEVLAQRNINSSLIPASSLKVITTGAALGILGKDYRFKTELSYDGFVDRGGTLQGNLYIKGYGDPTLGSDKMEGTPSMNDIMATFAQAAKGKGIKKVNGKIVGDGTHFETAIHGASWQWNDLGNYYGAGASGLNIHENMYYLRFQQKSSLGSTPPVVEVSPKVPYMVFNNELKSAAKGTGDNAYIYGSPYTFNRYIRGTIPVGSKRFTIKGSIPDPPYFAAHTLMNKLEDKGISTLKQTTTQLELMREGKANASKRQLVYTHQSPTLANIVERTNMKSINLYCEAMLKTLGQKKYKEGTAEAGVKAILEYWKSKGINLDGLFLHDGSGLSPRNGITTFQLASMMKTMAKDKTFKASLPVAGQSGTLKYMFKGTPAVGKLSAKSGSMERVRSYTGYATTKSGKKVAFAIICNNFTCKQKVMKKKLEKLMVAIVNN